ncbi:hypothetical protein MFUM_720030 [Methylacidiphilum fumariolicum SolV]|uniref:Uncharacterized protein n=2 Tax=Candidatus Methylacidiphilum fumarolicum TaxID=591154 RepID=I0JZJ4_METFB|nr:hypothetical protein [Candidatus Methylacidiphilum fumarolicum]CAI9085215.1 conserved protein of unknown function [Candidatus Methylacidiphilum fumarolicum]CCG92663.1 hypothetical protein MFUM_720030 [Methylacidiphilum fumariolicum SolV]
MLTCKMYLTNILIILLGITYCVVATETGLYENSRSSSLLSERVTNPTSMLSSGHKSWDTLQNDSTYFWILD